MSAVEQEWADDDVPGPVVGELNDKVTNLHRALQSRDTIGMAKGILMTTLHLTPDEAFDLLRIASQHDQQQRKVVVIAEEVVHTGELPFLPRPRPHLAD